ncbi:MAG: hypothetical protein JSR37_10180 [Verrucomicrobia bacterium]|nr:hypothetical protein [Verrucomicrobiota bacterium]
MNTIGARFSTDEKALTAYDGTIYPKIDYKSKLQHDLVYELQDPEFANRIFTAYERHILPSLRDDQIASFEKSLVETALVFGSLAHPPKLALKRTLERNGFTQELPDMGAFIAETCTKKPSRSTPVRKVCILHTTASGGNTAVARAIASFLQTRGITSDLLDVEELAREHDPMVKATGYTYDGLYADVFQKQNQTESKNGFPLFLGQRVALNQKITQYIAPCTLRKVRERIEALAPDFIISTRSYTNEDIHLAYSLDIPMSMVICDYDLFIQFVPAGKTDPSLFTFWLPRLTSRAFQFLLKDQYCETDGWPKIAHKIAALTKSTFEEIDASFKEIAYPVGPEYVRVEDFAPLRAKWEVKADEHLVVVTMGKNGVGVMKEIFDLLKDSRSVGIQYLFICGSNSELYDTLAAQKSQIRLAKQLTHQEMGELMNIASLILSKPGGGQAAQCRAMGVPMFVMHPHSLWESGNERELDSVGLVSYYDAERPLSEQIEQAVLKKPAEIVPPEDWKAKLEQIWLNTYV